MNIEALNASGYASGRKFKSPAEVRTYFTGANFARMFPGETVPTGDELDDMASYVINNHLHCDFERLFGMTKDQCKVGKYVAWKMLDGNIMAGKIRDVGFDTCLNVVRVDGGICTVKMCECRPATLDDRDAAIRFFTKGRDESVRPEWPSDVVFGFQNPTVPPAKPLDRPEFRRQALKFGIGFLCTFASRNTIVSSDWRSWECLAFTLDDLYRLTFDTYGRTAKMCNAMDLIPVRMHVDEIPEEFMPDLYFLHAAAQMLEKKYQKTPLK